MPIVHNHRKNFHYEIIKTIPLQEAITFIRQLPHKGFSRKHTMVELAANNPKCVICGVEGTKFCLGVDSAGGKHWDLYSEDDIALSLDHIVPKSRGGKNSLDNAQIMCTMCNSLKANKPERTDAYKVLIDSGIDVILTIAHKPWFRIGYWKRLDGEIFEKIKDFITEESCYDLDCGWQYVYYFDKVKVEEPVLID